jgi:hypothetical protein
MALIAIILWLVNLGISIWNAVAVGRAWVESKHAGGIALSVGYIVIVLGVLSSGAVIMLDSWVAALRPPFARCTPSFAVAIETGLSG